MRCTSAGADGQQLCELVCLMPDPRRIRAEAEAEAEEEKYIRKDKEFLRNHQQEGMEPGSGHADRCEPESPASR